MFRLCPYCGGIHHPDDDCVADDKQPQKKLDKRLKTGYNVCEIRES